MTRRDTNIDLQVAQSLVDELDLATRQEGGGRSDLVRELIVEYAADRVVESEREAA